MNLERKKNNTLDLRRKYEYYSSSNDTIKEKKIQIPDRRYFQYTSNKDL